MSRFTVGNKYKFAVVRFTRSESLSIRSLMYHPGIDTLECIEVMEMECVSEHAVPGYWSDRLEYVGYRFKDVEGNLWNNQYPRASYGQLDDSANWKITRDCEGMNVEQVHALREAQEYRYDAFDTLIDNCLFAIVQDEYPPEHMEEMKRFVRILMRLAGKTLEDCIGRDGFFRLMAEELRTKMVEAQ